MAHPSLSFVRLPAPLPHPVRAALEKGLQGAKPALVPPRAHLETVEQRIFEAEADASRILVVAVAGSEAAGLIDARQDHPGPGDVTIAQVVVLPPFRGRGIGLGLVLRAVRAAQRDGFVHASVLPGAEAGPFWSSLGFSEHGCGQWETTVARLEPAVAPLDPPDLPLALGIRRDVFIEEQGVPEALEVDGEDGRSAHLLARAGGRPVGCARLRAKAEGVWKVERVAVLAPVRGFGVGAALMGAAERFARDSGAASLSLSAQVPVLGFYEALGFEAFGEVFLDAGIHHRYMRKALTSPFGG